MLRETPPTPFAFHSPDDPSALLPPSDPADPDFPSPSPLQPTTTTTMDDIFSSSPPPSPSRTTSTPARAQHPSDIPHLRSTHGTAGYRDGIAASKEQYVQSGFDEGYALGAVLGLRVGWILGVLEGLFAALKSKPGRGEEEVGEREREGERERVRRLLGEARRELRTEGVFGGGFFGEDGVWRFDVGGGGGEGEVTFEEVADGHPLIGKWMGVVGREVERFGVDLRVFEGDGWERGRVGDEGASG